MLCNVWFCVLSFLLHTICVILYSINSLNCYLLFSGYLCYLIIFCCGFIEDLTLLAQVFLHLAPFEIWMSYGIIDQKKTPLTTSHQSFTTKSSYERGQKRLSGASTASDTMGVSQGFKWLVMGFTCWVQVFQCWIFQILFHVDVDFEWHIISFFALQVQIHG